MTLRTITARLGVFLCSLTRNSWNRTFTAALLTAVAAFGALSLNGQSCDAQANPIVCENQLTGNPSNEWDISGSGDSSLQGFTTEISVNKGETVHFKVDTTAATFQIDIYRLGYYGGQGARKIATIPGIAGRNQANCLTVAATGLIDCGNWLESASWAVPATAVSGIYVAKLSRSGGGSSHIVFIVRDDQRQADVIFQTSDTTWQAYNTYGGNSLYVGGPGTNPGRAYKVSYNRPFTTRGTGAEDWLFNAEYPMVRWLEANGYNVSYLTGVDTDRSGATELLRHRVFLSVGHDEYWSGQQRANVEAARAAGVNLAFFSGNEVFWKTRWEASVDGSNTPYRTLVSYKETHANAKIDPTTNVWTGTWRDPRFSPPADGGRPENALTGTLFTVNCCTTDGAIRVTQAFASQPFWRNTRVATLPVGGSTTFTPGTLGYEWDENVNNGFRPAGLTALSSTTLTASQKLQDNGSTYASGTATHVLTLYRHTSGALVFGAGTVQWSWGLDNDHDRGSAAPDLAMQQATVNLLADMAVQPGSLQPGLVSGTSDTTAPTVSLTSPANATTVSGSINVTATAADNIGVAGVQFKLDGANLGTEDTSSPYSLAWTTTSASNGPHTLTAVARDAAGNSTTSVAVGITVNNAQTPPPNGLSIDTTAFGDRSTSSTSIATSAFSTSAGSELLLAFVAADDTSAGGQQVSAVAGAGLTWQMVVRTGTQRGASEIWRALAPSSLSGAVVTATLAQSAAASITVVAFRGVDTSGTNGSGAIGAIKSASAASGAPTTSLVTTRNNSWVFGVGNDWAAATSRTVGSGQTMVHEYPATVGDTFWVQRQTSTTPASGTTVTINDTAPTGDQYNLALCEILPAAGGVDTSGPTVAITAPSGGATVPGTIAVTATASDASGVAGVQFKVDGNNVGAEDVTAPYSVSFTAANGTHVLTAVARDTLGYVTTSAQVSVTVNTGATTAMSVNGLQTFQTIDGIGVNINSLSWKNGELRPAIDMLADQMGATSWRVVFDMVDWEDVNDNADPNVADWTYYNAVYTNAKFQNLWGTLHYLNQKGITKNVTLSFMGRVSPWMGGSSINAASEDEWVETISSLLYYARNTEHVTFDLVNPINEPDWDGYEGPQVGAVQYTGLLRKLSIKLDALGLNDVRFIGPDTASATNGVNSYIPQMMADSVVMAKVDHFAFHDYNGSTAGANAAIAGSAYPTRDFWMTEFALPSDVMSLLGQNPAGLEFWEAYDSVYNHAILAGRGSTAPNDDTFAPALIAYNSATGTYTPRQVFYQYAQLTRFVPAGAIRVATTGTPSGVAVYAFHHAATGRVTVFGRNSSASAAPMTFSLSNLASVAVMQTYETTATANLARANDAIVTNGSLFYSAPANSFFTLTALGTPVVPPPTVAITAPSNGSTASGTVNVTANASSSIGIAGVQFKLDGANLGTEITTAPYSLAWDTTAAANGGRVLTAAARDTSNKTTTSAPVNVMVSNATASNLAIDVTAFGDRSNSATTIATSSFTTHATSELLLAFVSADDVSSANTVAGVSGGSLVWQLVVRTNAQRGTAEIWRTFAANVLTNVTVTATLAQPAAASITVVSVTGANATGTSGSGAIGATRSASAATGAPTASLVTTRDNSWVFGVGNDWSNAIARTVGTGQTMVHQYLATVGDTFWAQRRTATTPLTGTTVTINDTAPTGDRYNLSLCEIIPR